MKTERELTNEAWGMGKLRRAFAVAALAGVVSVPVLAQGPGGMGEGMGMGPHRPPMEREMGPRGEHARWWNEPRAIERLKLTETQRKAMDDIYQQHRLTLVDLHATLEKAELAMEPLISADQPDEAKILGQIDRVAQARAELEKANARMLLGIRRQLTPDQWKQMQAFRNAHREGDRGDGAGKEDGHRWQPRQGKGGPGGAGNPGGPGQGGPGGPGNQGAPPPPSGSGEQE